MRTKSGIEKKLRVLVIGAHPDDCETLAGGLSILYRRNDHDVKFVCATSGNATHPVLGGGQYARIRAEEMRIGCETADIEHEIFDIASNTLMPNIAIREAYIKLIRTYNPDLILTHRLNDYHPDHRYISVIIQDAIYYVTVPNICPLTPHLTRRPVIAYMYDDIQRPSFTPDIIIDIDGAIEMKVLMCHAHTSSMYEWTPWIEGHTDELPEAEAERLEWLRKSETLRVSKIAGKYRDRLIDKYGSDRGNRIVCAEAFEICPCAHGGMLNDDGTLNEDVISLYFPF